MPLVREPGTDARPILWDSWRAWKLRERLPEVIEYREHGGYHEREVPEDGLIETGGAASGCFACAAHPGRVYRRAANGEGHVSEPCPVCSVTED